MVAGPGVIPAASTIESMGGRLAIGVVSGLPIGSGVAVALGFFFGVMPEPCRLAKTCVKWTPKKKTMAR